MSNAKDDTEVETEAKPELYRPTPMELLVSSILEKRAFVSVPVEDFPPATRSGNVAAQRQAAEELVKLESRYAEYLKSAAVAAIIRAETPALAQQFLEGATEESEDPPVVLDASEMYVRIANAVAPAVGDSRQFSAGKVGMAIDEMAAIGRELSLTSLAAPRWQYDVMVPTFADLVDVIRTAVRASTDGDELNRLYLRSRAYKRALDLGYVSAIVPVMVTGATPEETPMLTDKLFTASTVIDVTSAKGVTRETVLSALKAMVKAAKARRS